MALLDPIKGSEQAGTRPVIVISLERLNQLLKVLNVVPITSRKPSTDTIYPNEVLLPAGSGGLRVDSIALCYQIRTLDKSRLQRHLGELKSEQLRHEITEALRFQLDM